MASRRTLRLTFKSSDAGVELLSTERLDMTTPPQPGERPQAGRHSGYWFELRGEGGDVLAHRLTSVSVLNAVAAHAPESPPHRVFTGLRSIVFEVLLPDIEGGRTVTLVGNPLAPGERVTRPSADLVTFGLPPQGGNP